VDLGLDRWTREHPDYITSLNYYRERQYLLAIDHLERLVVQRLMEMEKCNVRGTSELLLPFFISISLRLDYKMRKLIAKHLQTRSKTIRTALNAYNRAAKPLKKPTLTFAKILEIEFLEEFDLLRDCRQDVRNRAWAKSPNRLLRDSYFKARRAKEEIDRLNVEIDRLYDWEAKEDLLYVEKIAELNRINPVLSCALQERQRAMRRSHNEIFLWLQRCKILPGYSGRAHIRLERIVANQSTAGDEESDSDSDEQESEIDRAFDVLEHVEQLE
jgi:hypothetical protein